MYSVLSKSGVSSTDMLRIERVSSFVRFVDDTAWDPGQNYKQDLGLVAVNSNIPASRKMNVSLIQLHTVIIHFCACNLT